MCVEIGPNPVATTTLNLRSPCNSLPKCDSLRQPETRSVPLDSLGGFGYRVVIEGSFMRTIICGMSLLLFTGCSNAPVAGTLDWIFPSRARTNRLPELPPLPAPGEPFPTGDRFNDGLGANPTVNDPLLPRNGGSRPTVLPAPTPSPATLGEPLAPLPPPPRIDRN